MAEGERAQEHPQRRWGTHLVEQPWHPAVAQQVRVADRVTSATIAVTSARTFATAFAPALPAMLINTGQQLRQPAPGGQTHHRRQSGTQHEIRFIEPRADRAPNVG
jgi:hypothetical protein